MPSDPPLTDEEICRKHEIAVDHPYFRTAKLLAYNRPDRTVCLVPECKCPHCGHDFTATYRDLGDGDPANGKEMPCEQCDRIIYIEHIAEPEDGDEQGTVYVTLCTDPEPTE